MKTYLTCLLASLLLLAAIAQPVAAKQGDTGATLVEKNGTKTKGYIAQAGEDDFVVRDRKTDAPTTIRYADVAKVESNRGHSTARNLGLGIAIGAGALLVTILAVIAHLD